MLDRLDLPLKRVRHRHLPRPYRHPNVQLPVTRAQLERTQSAWSIRYSNFLSPEEFAKFIVLMRGLPPSVVVLVRPANEARIRVGDWPAIRENLQLVLNGTPKATPLFPPE
jgi:hypothetical protein